MHYRVYALNVADFILIFVFFRNVATYRDTLKRRASIINNEIITLRVFSYEKTITKTINRIINIHSLAMTRDLDLSKTIENLFDNDYQN